MPGDFGKVGSAYVDLEARVDRFERDLAAARQTLAREQRRMQQDANQTAGVFAGLNQQFGLIRAAVGTVIAAQATQRLIGYGDAWRSISAQLDRSIGSAEAARVAQDQLFQSAQRAGVEFGSVTNLFVSTNRAATSLGASLDEVTTFTEAVTNSMAGATGSAEAMSGSLQQLSQLLFAPVVQMDEFRSILDGIPGLAVAAARGLGEIGVTADGSVESMFALAASGKLLSRDFFRAIVQQAPELANELNKAADTTGKAMTRIQNALLATVGAADQQAGATSRLTTALNSLAAAIEDDAFRGFVETVLTAGVKLMELQVNYTSALVRDFKELGSLAAPLFTQNLNADLEEAQRGFDELLRKRDELRAAGDTEAIGGINQELARALSVVNDLKRQVAERAAVAGAQGEAPGGPGPRPGGGPTPPKIRPAPTGPSDADKAAERAAARIRDTVSALEFERAQLQRNAEEQSIYNALKSAGVEATSEAGQQIRRLVEDIAALTQAEALQDLSLQFRIEGLDESEQQVAKILQDLELLRGIEGGRVVVDVDDQGTVDLLRERLAEVMEREYRAHLDTTQFETQIATMEQAAADAARQLRDLGIIQDVSDLRRPEVSGKFGELTRANEDRARVEQARAELDEVNRLAREGQDNSLQFGNVVGSAFEDAAFEVRDMNDALGVSLGLLEDVNRLIFRQFITAPLVQGIASGLQGLFPGAYGGTAAARGAILHNARGRVVRHPTYFAYGGTTGYMSERYPEAIMPLSQTTGGLGVRALPPDMSPVIDAAAALHQAAGALAQGGGGRGGMPEVRVFNNVGGAEATVQQGQDSAGMPTLDVIFDSQMQAAQRTRRLDRHLAPYGARRAPTRR